MTPAADTLTLRRPDDWHVHLRDGPFLRAVVGFTAERFARAIVMPNLVPPVTSLESARAYRQRILDALPEGIRFEPLMTWYLTDDTDPDVVVSGFEEGLLTAVKLYPAHATTNSAFGVTDMKCVRPVLARMETIGMPLLLHGEVTDPTVDVFDREAVFIDRVLKGLRADFPELKMVLEHVTTEEAVAFVEAQDGRLGATVTPHHLMINRNALFDGGLRPHAYCLPLAKRERHRIALRRAVASGHPAFFSGTDSAPHRIGDKESDCGCAGVFCGPGALEFYTQVFDAEGALDKLEAFTSFNGPRFYGLPENEDRVTLVREPWTVPADVHLEGGAGARPFRCGETVPWRLADA